jgi:hypothetical protein
MCASGARGEGDFSAGGAPVRELASRLGGERGRGEAAEVPVKASDLAVEEGSHPACPAPRPGSLLLVLVLTKCPLCEEPP